MQFEVWVLKIVVRIKNIVIGLAKKTNISVGVFGSIIY